MWLNTICDFETKICSLHPILCQQSLLVKVGCRQTKRCARVGAVGCTVMFDLATMTLVSVKMQNEYQPTSS